LDTATGAMSDVAVAAAWNSSSGMPARTARGLWDRIRPTASAKNPMTYTPRKIEINWIMANRRPNIRRV